MPKAKQEKVDRTLFTTDRGMEIRLKEIDAMFLQTVSRSVKMPEVPTYETKTYSGRTETHEFDAKAAEQTPGGIEIWNKYQQDLQDAVAEQNDRVLRAAYLDGTVRPENWFDEKWHRRMKIVHMELPEDEDELWVLYLLTSLSQDDIAALTTAIVRLTGVPEEMIEAAEEIFRGSVRSTDEREEPDVVAEGAGANTGA